MESPRKLTVASRGHLMHFCDHLHVPFRFALHGFYSEQMAMDIILSRRALWRRDRDQMTGAYRCAPAISSSSSQCRFRRYAGQASADIGCKTRLRMSSRADIWFYDFVTELHPTSLMIDLDVALNATRRPAR